MNALTFYRLSKTEGSKAFALINGQRTGMVDEVGRNRKQKWKVALMKWMTHFFFNPGVLETANLHHGPSRLCQSKDRALKDELKEQ